MVTWHEFSRSEPGLAAAVRSTFDADRHAVLATLRKDGAPRASGIEPTFHGEELWLVLMPGSVKAADLHRDPRCALHTATSEHRCGYHNPASVAALLADDAKISGRAVPVTDTVATYPILDILRAQGPMPPDSRPELLRMDIEEVSTVSYGEEGVVIRSWNPGQPARTRHRG